MEEQCARVLCVMGKWLHSHHRNMSTAIKFYGNDNNTIRGWAHRKLSGNITESTTFQLREENKQQQNIMRELLFGSTVLWRIVVWKWNQIEHIFQRNALWPLFRDYLILQSPKFALIYATSKKVAWRLKSHIDANFAYGATFKLYWGCLTSQGWSPCWPFGKAKKSTIKYKINRWKNIVYL